MKKVQNVELNSCDFYTNVRFFFLLFCKIMSAGYILVSMAATQFA